MSKNKINITYDNLTEWLCSTGYLFPRNEIELSRFERIYPEVERKSNDDSVDPFTIIDGSRQRKPFRLDLEDDEIENLPELRMAARKYKNLPDHIIEKIKKNQNKLSDYDKPED